MNKSQKFKLELQLRQDANILLDIIWEEVGDESFESLAKRAGLCTATIYRLWGGVWKRPQLLTIQKLARAVGLNVQVNESGLTAIRSTTIPK